MNGRFVALWKELGADGAADLISARVLKMYSAPERTYHNLSHIEDCLRHFDGARQVAERPREVEIAVWFHDAFYDPQANNNEEKSASFACGTLKGTGLDNGSVDYVKRLILATKHDHAPDFADGRLIADIDLAIFGQAAEVFDAYEAAVRKEYHWVSDMEYRGRCAKLIKTFLKRPSIYYTACFKERLENRARKNLLRSLSRL